MTIAGPDYIRNLQNNSFPWGLSSEPVNPANPTISNSLQPAITIGIAAQSAQAETAWKVLAFINGEQVAGLRARVADEIATDFPVRTSLIDNESLKPFYQLEANPAKWTKSSSRIDFFQPIMEEIISKEMSLMSAGQQTLNQTTHNIETSANAEWSKNESWGD